MRQSADGMKNVVPIKVSKSNYSKLLSRDTTAPRSQRGIVSLSTQCGWERERVSGKETIVKIIIRISYQQYVHLVLSVGNRYYMKYVNCPNPPHLKVFR